MKIVFINVPWMKYYVGEGDEEKTPPLSGYNFQHFNGFYYGYGEGLEEIAIENIEGISTQEDKAEDVLVVWTAKNRENEHKIIGWYKKATIYRKKQSQLTLDSDRIILNYAIVAKAENCTLLPPELRLLDVKEMPCGIYFEKDEQVIKDVAMYTHNYGGDKLNVLLEAKDLVGESVLNFQEIEMYFAKADEFLAKDLYGKAIRCFNKAIALEPDLSVGYEFKGSVLLSLKMYREALDVYKKVVALEGDNGEASYVLGLLYGLNGDYKNCLDYLESYIKDHPKDMNALAERSIAYYHLGDVAQAKEGFARAYQKETDNPVFGQLIAYVAGL